MKTNINKTAIVTGASRGIGFAIAEYLAKKEYQLLLLSKSEINLERAKEKLILNNPNIKEPLIKSLDVSNYKAAKEAVDSFILDFGHIDILCNAAGYVKRGTTDLFNKEFLRMIDTNLIGSFNFMQIVSKYMKDRKHGRIINISSKSGVVARKELGGYSASKFGLMGLNEAAYKELSSFGIYVTAICPNWVDTDMTSDIQVDRNELMKPEDIVKTVDYLLNLSSSVAIQEIIMQCRAQLIIEA